MYYVSGSTTYYIGKKGGRGIKTKETLALEALLYAATHKQGIFCCFEVTIGWFGKERVDYMTYDTKGVFRCYELKVSKADFHSSAHITFLGHFNYYVMPEALYAEVKNEISDWVGVYIQRGNGLVSVQKAKRQSIDPQTENLLKNSLLRSLAREADKVRESESVSTVNRLKTRIRQLEREKQAEYRRYWALLEEVMALYGPHWKHPKADTEGKEIPQ